MDDSSAGPGAVRLLHDDDRDRYEALEDDAVVAVLYYGDEPGSAGTTLRDLRSTVVDPEHSGRGIGSALVRFALDDIRSRGFTARATCWFVRGWIDRHSRYADLLTTDPEEGTTAP